MELPFNELSLEPLASDVYEARRRMETLLATLHAVSASGVTQIVRTLGNFWNRELAPNYGLAHWAEDREVDRVWRQRLKAATGRAPFIEELLAANEDAFGRLAEFKCAGKQAQGLGLAAISSRLALSLPSQPWECDALDVECHYETDLGASDEVVSVCNLHSAASARSRHEWIRDRLREEFVTGKELVRSREQVLQRIDFTAGAREQLESLTAADPTFPLVVRHLFALHARAAEWTDGPFDHGYAFQCSRDSDQTLHNYGSERTFKCADGVSRVFSWHSKISLSAWRIHFIADPTQRRVTVGYIGPHLPTVSNPT
jgi:hypothetical protein